MRLAHVMHRFRRKLFRAIGYEMTITPSVLPAELTVSDKRLLKYVQDEQLSMGSDSRLYATILACKHVVTLKIPGAFVECGVWRGGHALLAQGLFTEAAQSRQVFLFDTFGGMTVPTDVDVSFSGQAAKQTFLDKLRGDHNEWCFASLQEVTNNFERAGLLNENVRMVKGDVALTLANPDALPDSISILRLDTDWYESTKIELEMLYPRLVPGGVLIIDDYGHWGGCRKAVDEYFSASRARPLLNCIDYTARVGIKPE